jgi:hypothetical protein
MALGSDLLMFVKLVASEEFGEDLPFMSDLIDGQEHAVLFPWKYY